MDSQSLSNILLLSITLLSAGLTGFWFGLTLWTWRDMRARSRDVLAQMAATLLVFLLPGFGIMVYLLLRPRETLADAYERSLEEEALLQEIEERPSCPGCGRAVQKDWLVCPYCHTRLKKSCHNCGYRLELTWNICPSCALPQTARGEERLQAQARPKTSSGDRSPYDYDPDANLQFVEE